MLACNRCTPLSYCSAHASRLRERSQPAGLLPTARESYTQRWWSTSGSTRQACALRQTATRAYRQGALHASLVPRGHRTEIIVDVAVPTPSRRLALSGHCPPTKPPASTLLGGVAALPAKAPSERASSGHFLKDQPAPPTSTPRNHLGSQRFASLPHGECLSVPSHTQPRWPTAVLSRTSDNDNKRVRVCQQNSQ